MARIESLNILAEEGGKDYLKELYGDVVQNVEKGTISGQIKNKNLSGNPVSGTVEAKRLAFAESKAYGTARTSGKGEAVKAKTVTVAINVDKELVEEVEEKDTTLYGVDAVIEKRTLEHQRAMIRELDKAFFKKAGDIATTVTPAATDVQDKFESLVLQLEETKNNYVDGVPRDMISVAMTPTEYSKLRKYINEDIRNANVDSSTELFGRLNGVRVFSCNHLPSGVKMIAMCDESIAQPVLPKQYNAEKIPLSSSYALELFFSYGTEAVMPDLVAKLTT